MIQRDRSCTSPPSQVTFERAARLFCWMVAIAGLLAISGFYDRLPGLIPVTRWTSAPRTPLLAVRISCINLGSLFLVELLYRAVHRTSFASESSGVAGAVFMTLGLKSVIETAELFAPSATWLFPVLIGTVVVGLGAAVACGWNLVRRTAFRDQVHFTPLESIAAGVTLSLILGFQAGPFIAKLWS